jgi:hypothetical protein
MKAVHGTHAVELSAVSEVIQARIVDIAGCESAAMKADGITKSFNPLQFPRILELMGLRPPSDHQQMAS